MKGFIKLVFIFLISIPVLAQEEDIKAKEKELRNSTNLTWEGNKKLSENNFIAAEVDYRMAISESPENAAAPYNLGNAYYNNETYNEAFSRFKEAGETAVSKKEKHKAYHNMGNVFMKRKDYAKAVEAYKEALRNDPKDEETRYNLALAKEMLKKEEDNKDKNDENKDKEDQQDKKDKDENKEGDNKDDKNQDKKDEGDKGDEGDQEKDENKEGDGDKKEEQNKKPEQGDQPQDQPQKRPDQLSKQQVENLLRAMQNAEKKVQDKIDAKKVQGAKVKNEKDW